MFTIQDITRTVRPVVLRPRDQETTGSGDENATKFTSRACAVHCNSLLVVVYHRWITNNFPCKWHRTASTASGCKSSPRKIFHSNSSRERWLKFIGERIEEDYSEAEAATKILQLHYKRNRWREETPSANASKSRQRLKFTVKITFFDAAIGSKNCARQQYLSNGVGTADQPLHHEQQWVLQ